MQDIDEVPESFSRVADRVCAIFSITIHHS